MTVSLTLEVPKELARRVKKLDNASVAAKCNNEIRKRVKYLETVLKGWKTYKHVNQEHSRVLYMMLMSDHENGLYDYEKLVLVPKIVESEKAAGPQLGEKLEPIVVNPQNDSGPTTSKESKNTPGPKLSKESKLTIVESAISSGPQTSKESEPTKKGSKNAPESQTTKKSESSKIESKNASGPETSKESSPTVVESKKSTGPVPSKESKPTIVESKKAPGPETSEESKLTTVESKKSSGQETSKETKPTIVESEKASRPQTIKQSKPTELDLGTASTAQASNSSKVDKKNETELQTKQESRPTKMELEKPVGAENKNKELTPTELEMGRVGDSKIDKEPTQSALEINNARGPQEPTAAKILDLGSSSSSTTSTVDLGAESSESSNEEDSGSSSPTVEYQPLINEEKCATPQIVIENDYDDKMFKKPIGIPIRSRARFNSLKNNSEDLKKNVVSTSDNAPSSSVGEQASKEVASKKRLPSISEIVDIGEMQEDKSVVSATVNKILARNIIRAAQRVKSVMGNGNGFCAGHESKMIASAKEMGLEALGGNELINLVNNVVDDVVNNRVNREVEEVVNDDANDNIGLSQGALKRKKRAAKKAAAIAAAKQKEIEEEVNRQHQRMLAKEALKILAKQKSESKTENENPDTPVTNEEMELYHEICKSGQKEFPEGSKEKALIDKFEANQDKLKAHIAKKCDAEKKFNQMCMNHIQEISDEILDLEKTPLTESEQHDKAIGYVIKRLAFWKKSDSIQAGYYVDMYGFLLENMTPPIAQIVSGFIPYDVLPNANFEHTLLLRYQSGKFQTQTV